MRPTVALTLASWLCAALCAAQQPDSPAPQPPPKTRASAQAPSTSTAPNPGAPLRITLQDALALARKNDPTYHAAVTDAGIAREDRAQARDVLLPTATFNTSALYTEPSYLNSPTGATSSTVATPAASASAAHGPISSMGRSGTMAPLTPASAMERAMRLWPARKTRL